MEKLQFDLTTKEGLTDTEKNLRMLQNNKSIGMGAIATIEIDIEAIIKDITNLISSIIERFFDLFDDTKKLEKQMELAIKTIEVARASGAKAIDITVNAKNAGKIETFFEEINATVDGELKKDNSITYSIKF